MPGQRIGSGQRFVQEQHLRIVHERLGQFNPLTHPFRVTADRPALMRFHADGIDGLFGGLAQPSWRFIPASRACVCTKSQPVIHS